MKVDIMKNNPCLGITSSQEIVPIPQSVDSKGKYNVVHCSSIENIVKTTDVWLYENFDSHPLQRGCILPDEDQIAGSEGDVPAGNNKKPNHFIGSDGPGVPVRCRRLHVDHENAVTLHPVPFSTRRSSRRAVRSQNSAPARIESFAIDDLAGFDLAADVAAMRSSLVVYNER